MSRQAENEAVYKMAEKLLADFAEDIVMNGNRPDKVPEFFNKLASILEKEEYLSGKEAAQVKHKAETMRLVITDREITDREKIYYQVARFTKEIGLSKISDYFMDKSTAMKIENISNDVKSISTAIKDRMVAFGDSNKGIKDFGAVMKDRDKNTHGR